MPCRTLSSRRNQTNWGFGKVNRMNSRPNSAGSGPSSADRCRSKSFHIIFDPSTPFGVVAWGPHGRDVRLQFLVGQPPLPPVALLLCLVEVVGRAAGIARIGQGVSEKPASAALDATNDIAPHRLHRESGSASTLIERNWLASALLLAGMSGLAFTTGTGTSRSQVPPRHRPRLLSQPGPHLYASSVGTAPWPRRTAGRPRPPPTVNSWSRRPLKKSGRSRNNPARDTTS